MRLVAAVLKKEVVGYSLMDMANDTISLLDHLRVEKAHIIGASMGGMLTQLVGIHYPERVLSLCSIMSNSGSKAAHLQASTFYQFKIFLRPVPDPADEQACIAHTQETNTLLGLPGQSYNLTGSFADAAAKLYARNPDRSGVPRQLMAIATAPARDESLKRLKPKLLILHGAEDKLVPPSNGVHLHSIVPNSRLVVIPNMGHSLPDEAMDHIHAALIPHLKETSP